MYRSFSIIGAGSLGGFVAREIANLPTTKKIVLVDFDVVEKRNLRNSVYRKPHVGKHKIKALANLLKRDNPRIELDLRNNIYKEGTTWLPMTDLIIDCRDEICSRGASIDIRLYISSRNLIIDCRKNVSYEEHSEGTYLTELSKHELKYAASCFVMLLTGNIMNKMIEKQVVHKIYLDQVAMKGANTLSDIEESKDLVRDVFPGEEKLIGLSENIFKIIEMNAESQLEVYVGDSSLPSNIRYIPKNSLQKPADVIRCLTTSIDQRNQPITFNYYIVSPTEFKSKRMIELIPETGAA